METPDSFETSVIFHQITGHQEKDHNSNSQPSEFKFLKKRNVPFKEF
jgi:hypothetical protein